VRMGPFATILFPTDFSRAAIEMVPYVNEMAGRFGAKVIVLHAFDLVHECTLAPPLEASCEVGRTAIPYTPEFEKLRSERQDRLVEFARSQFPNIRPVTRIEDGDPARVIELIAQVENTDLIVMATKGLGTFRRLLLGSITAKVLHDISSPVLTSAHQPDSQLAPPRGFRSIVCAVELNHESSAVFKAADFLAQTYGARLCLVHTESRLFREHDQQATAEAVRSAFEKVVNADSKRIGTDVKACALDASVPEGIRNAAIQEKADLVVVGRGHERGNLSRIWSHLYTIIRESPCPVLSV